MSKLSIEARVTAGTNVEKAIMDAIALSSRLGVYIDIRFNGVRLSLCRSDQLPIKLEEYHRELAVLARANELLPGETPADISKLPSGEFQPVLTLEEIIIKIWNMAISSVSPSIVPNQANVVRQDTLKWASFELNERAERCLKAGVDKVAQFITDYVRNNGSVAEKYTDAKDNIATEWQPIVSLLDKLRHKGNGGDE